MTPTRALTLSATLFGLCAAAVAMAREVPEAPPPRKVVHYFPTTVGAKWTYRGADGKTFEKEVTKVESKGDRTAVTVVFREPDGKTTPGGEYEVSGRGVLRLDPPVWQLKLPAPAGARWSYDGRPPHWLRESFFAGKPERVTVPAGTFDAIPVESTVWTDRPVVELMDSTTEWYTPGVGPVKWTRHVWEKGGGPVYEVVLVSFTPGTPKP
jgi:hypothetical protein